jgi:hypothetical protein
MPISAKQRVLVAYVMGALGLLLAVGAAVVLPSTIYPSCPAGQICEFNGQVNIVKIVLMSVGLLLALTGCIIAGFRSYLAQSG